MSTDLQIAEASLRKVQFSGNSEFQNELKRRVDEFFRTTGRKQRDDFRMYLKTFILLSCLAGSYITLVFVVTTWWQAIPMALILGLSTASIGFNVQHDGGHQAYSNRRWANKMMATTLDLVGGSSYLWHWKHAFFHHTYVNITGEDSDIDLGILARLSPHQRRLPFHRWQHWYLWVLYGLIAIKWEIYDDFRDIISGRMGKNRFPRPKGWDLVIFFGGKILFFTLALVIPLLVHPVWVVLTFYAGTVLVLGIVLSVVFQVAHCVEEAQFPLPSQESGRIEQSWAVHQVETTANFARRNRLLCWFLGGLNFQIEHHLFPRICHVHYPAIAPLVEDTCREFGIRYNEHKTFRAGIASHFRFLRRMALTPASLPPHAE